jgi:hypothetical protein
MERRLDQPIFSRATLFAAPILAIETPLWVRRPSGVTGTGTCLILWGSASPCFRVQLPQDLLHFRIRCSLAHPQGQELVTCLRYQHRQNSSGDAGLLKLRSVFLPIPSSLDFCYAGPLRSSGINLPDFDLPLLMFDPNSDAERREGLACRPT